MARLTDRYVGADSDTPMASHQDGAMLNGGVSEGDVLWVPSAEVVRDARITRFQESVGRPGSYDDLWSWSVEEPAAFWTEVWDYFGVIGDRANGPVITGNMPQTQWFAGSAD